MQTEHINIMSQEKKYDIFISYRRIDTGQRAEHLKDLLDFDYKDRISFDRENLTGLFDVELARRIDNCIDFLLLIDEKSLVYTEDDNSDAKISLYNYLATASIDEFEAKINELGPEYPLDFVRIEIARALHRRDVNIIPIVPETSDKFNFAKLYLPKDIVGLKRYEAIFFSKNKDSLFKDILNKLRKHLKTSKTSKKNISSVDSVVYKIRVDRKCTLFIDDEYFQDIEANKLTKISLPKGEYLRKVVDLEDENVYTETEIQLIDGSKLDDIQLNDLFQSAVRIKTERAEEEKRKIVERAHQDKERLRKEKELQEKIAQAEAAQKALEEKMRLTEEKMRQVEENARQAEKHRLAEKQALPRMNVNNVNVNSNLVQTDAATKVLENSNNRLDFIVNGIPFSMIRVEGGTFMMGAISRQRVDAFNRELPVREVTLSTYYIGETLVTQELWMAVMDSNPSYFNSDLKNPVEQVSWEDCQVFIQKLNQITGNKFRLPTEAEWEFAARGGINSLGYKYSGSNQIKEVAWQQVPNEEGKTHPVGLRRPNELGVYDMSGNVWEWCNDWFGAYIVDELVNPHGPKTGNVRVCRGGCWHSHERYCCVFFRSFRAPHENTNYIGLRLVMEVNENE